MKYFKVWKQLSACAIGSYLSNRLDIGSYLAGKILRFSFFLLLIISIFRFTDNLAGYTEYEAIFLFLTFNLIDILPQAFFRGIYLLQQDVKTGNFDYIISRPVNPLFYSLTRQTDILDIITLIPLFGAIAFMIAKMPVAVGFTQIASYVIFIFVSLLIVIGLHMVSAAITIKTVESENAIWLYREFMSVGRFPPEIFPGIVQLFFTFILPIIIIVAFPVKALLGALSWQWGLVGLIYALLFIGLSYLYWRHNLKYYSSASS